MFKPSMLFAHVIYISFSKKKKKKEKKSRLLIHRIRFMNGSSHLNERHKSIFGL